MALSKSYITIIIDPDTEYEQVIYYDGNHGQGYTLIEALERIDGLNRRQRDYVQDFFKTSVQFNIESMNFPQPVQRVNPARFPRRIVDWSRMRPVPPPPKPTPVITGELDDLDDDPFSSEAPWVKNSSGERIEEELALYDKEDESSDDLDWEAVSVDQEEEGLPGFSPVQSIEDDGFDDDDDPI